MFGRAGAHVLTGPLRARLAALFADRRGVAALEFALIAPLLLCMYFMTMEAAQGIETNKKVSRIGSMVADLITQQQSVKKDDLKAIMRIGQATLAPYSRSTPEIIVTAIQVTDETTPRVKVVWSLKLLDGNFVAGPAKDSIATIPPTLNVKGTFLIRVESILAYKPVIAWAAADTPALGLTAAFSNITMKEVYHLRPRMTQAIPCSDC